jgi:hypothetical protein
VPNHLACRPFILPEQQSAGHEEPDEINKWTRRATKGRKMEGTEKKVEEIKAEDTPNVLNMSYEDLEKNLNPIEEKEELKEPEAKPSETETDVKTDDKAQNPEPDKQETQDSKQEPVDYEAKLKALEEEVTSLRNRMIEKERMIAKQGTEIGLLRGNKNPNIAAYIKQAKDEYERIKLEQGDFEAAQYMKEVEANVSAMEQQIQQANIIQSMHNTRERLTREIPSFETSIDDISMVMKDDGIPDDIINKFKENPYILSNHGELRLLYKAAMYRKENSSLKAENESLKTKIMELEKQPEQLINKIKQAERATLTGKTSGTSSRQDNVIQLNKPLARYSYAELEELQKQNLSGG